MAALEATQGSVYYPRILWHAGWRKQGLKHWLYFCMIKSNITTPPWPGVTRHVWVISALWWWAGGGAGWSLHLYSAVELQEFGLQQLSDSPLSLIPAVWGLQLSPSKRREKTLVQCWKRQTWRENMRQNFFGGGEPNAKCFVCRKNDLAYLHN